MNLILLAIVWYVFGVAVVLYYFKKEHGSVYFPELLLSLLVGAGGPLMIIPISAEMLKDKKIF